MKDVEARLIHDIKNTATVLRGAALQLEDSHESLPPAAVSRLTEMLVRRSDMLVRLLGDLSTSHLADRDELDLALTRVSLSELCAQVLAARTLDADTLITLDVPDDVFVIADPLRLTQVLDNLVSNALRYGGSSIRVSTVHDQDVVELSVHDDGVGVPDALVERLFEAYVHGSSSQSLGGSGLGLSIARQLCDAMGGTLTYDGSGGTRFTAGFPAVPTPSVVLDADPAPDGHSVAFWADTYHADVLLDYVANGLAAGEAVVVAATPEHHKALEERLNEVGIDHMAVTGSGQFVALNADALHRDLAHDDHIDTERFDLLIGGPVRRVSGRWGAMRVYGEIVDLYWRRSDDHLALELEACWNDLRRHVEFPLLCGYQLAEGEHAHDIIECHDVVVAA